MIQNVSSALKAGASPPAVALWAKTFYEIVTKITVNTTTAGPFMIAPYLRFFI